MSLPTPSRTLSFTLPAGQPPVETSFLNLGHHQHPSRRLAVNSRHLSLDGQPWMPVMGEFHYSRTPEVEWETELRKMRAGGVDIVASYVIWNHHEPRPGQWRWDGQRDLRRFIATAAGCGLFVYLRPGPWSHAEVRLGGFPDWLEDGRPLRCNDPAYLGPVAELFRQVGAQARGLLWSDGGPVIGLQLENEYGRTGPGCGAEHIAELKRLAIEAGLTVPLYTVTGWPTLDIPPREVAPVSGAYADGFWSGARGPLPPSGVFVFNTQRVIGEMGNVDGTPAAAHIDKAHYPFFLAEAGGGMHQAYHRRPVVTPEDVYATTLVQLGSGATLYGYYMYHGGTNPRCETGPLNETQRSGYPNDVPEWGYDFHAPLGQYGQVRRHWGRLRCLHLFMQAFGPQLALADPQLPEGASLDAADLHNPRLAWRGVGEQGFLFVNHHVRHHPLPPMAGLQVQLVRPDGAHQSLPTQPFDLHTGDAFIWPVGQRLGAATLRHATVQPLTTLPLAGGGQLWVGFWLPGQAIELVFDSAGLEALGVGEHGEAEVVVVNGEAGQPTRVRVLPPADPAADAAEAPPVWLRLRDAAGTEHHVLLLSPTQAEATARAPLGGRDRLVISSHPVTWTHTGELQLHRPQHEAAWLQVWPPEDLNPGAFTQALPAWPGFARHDWPAAQAQAPVVRAQLLRAAEAPPAPQWGPPVSWRDGPVPLVPDEAAHAGAARWQLQLPEGVQPTDGRLLLALDYAGDIARLEADGVVVDDHFHDGDTWWLGLDRHARADGGWPSFGLTILPRADDLPVFLEDAARAQGGVARLVALQAALWTCETLRAVVAPAAAAPAP